MIKHFVILFWIAIIILLLNSCASLQPRYKTNCGTTGVYWSIRNSKIKVKIANSEPNMPLIFDSEVEIIKSAIDTWNKDFSLFELCDSPNCKYDLLIRYDGLMFTETQEAIARNFIDGPIIHKSIIFINIKYVGSHNIDLKSLMIHELGHVLGLDHVENTVMDSTLAPYEIRDIIEYELKSKVSCLYDLNRTFVREKGI